jgi:hypothetical protein
MSTKLNVAQRKEAQGIISLAADEGVLTEAIYRLIEGRDIAYDEGEDVGWAATKMLWDRMGEWQKEWQAEVPKERASCFNDALELVEWKIAAARAEGAEQEREKLQANGGFLAKGSYASSNDCFDDVMQRESGEFATVAVCDCYITPASILAPKETK